MDPETSRAVFTVVAATLLLLTTLGSLNGGGPDALLRPPPKFAPAPAPTPSPSHAPRYLVVSSLAYGRYSNNHECLLEALALAHYSSRTLVVSDGTGLVSGGRVVAHDEAVLAAAGYEVASTSSPATRCPPGLQHVAINIGVGASWGNPGKTTSWGDVNWLVVHPHGTVPPELSKFVGNADRVFSAPVYRDFASPHMRSILNRYLGPAEAPLWIRDSPASCVLIGTPFFSVHWAMMPGEFERVVAAVRPPPAVVRLVDEWFANRRIAPGAPTVAVHVRLTDQRGRGYLGLGFADRCANEPVRGAREVVAALAPWLSAGGPANASAASGAGGRRAPVLLIASDDRASECVAAIVKGLSAGVSQVEFADGPDPAPPGAPARPALSNVLHTEFIQEVLARSDAFVGTTFSTFSSVILQIRTLRLGRPLNTSFLM